MLILIIILTAGLMSSVLSGLLVTAVLMPAVVRLVGPDGAGLSGAIESGERPVRWELSYRGDQPPLLPT